MHSSHSFQNQSSQQAASIDCFWVSLIAARLLPFDICFPQLKQLAQLLVNIEHCSGPKFIDFQDEIGDRDLELKELVQNWSVCFLMPDIL